MASGMNGQAAPARAVLKWGLPLVVVAAAAAALVGERAQTVPAHVGHGAAHMSAAAPGAAARPAAVPRPVSCEKLPHVPGKSITTLIVEFPPNAYTPKHHHAGSVTAFVLKGTLRSQLNAGPIETFTPGQTWFEPPGTSHTMIENASATEPAAILATFVADDCAVLTVYD
ncbi:MAG: cupin domain-containing protein [Rhodospirillales bacterium]